MVVPQNSFFSEDQRKMQATVKQIIDQVKMNTWASTLISSDRSSLHTL